MKSIRGKLLLSMLGVAFALILVLSVSFINIQQNSTEQIVQNTVAPLAYQASERIGLAVDASDNAEVVEDNVCSILNNIDICKGNMAFIINMDGEFTFKCKNIGSFGLEKTLLHVTDSDNESISDFAKEAVIKSDGYGTFEFNDTEYIAGYSKVTGHNSVLIIAVPTNELSQYTHDAFKGIIIVCIILVALVSLFSIFFARTFSRPIVKTTNRLRALAQGNLTDPVDVRFSHDELGVLSRSLEETIVSLRQYINLITVALTNIAEGNLCHRMEGTFKGDFLKIKTTFNTILESLSDTFSSINTAAEQVNSGAIQVSNAAQALSQGSTEQASSIEQLSATLSDVANQITYNAEAAKNAYKIVHDNTISINDCNSDMSKMLTAMNEINESSEQISKIIKVIDEIAFQTNILALNAAVEAAREGSKGFGVVADEVRRLAAKSAEAAQQTSSLIEASSAAVKRGSNVATVTADSLHTIVENSAEIKKLVKDISEASEHQSEAVVQINTGVDQISAVVAANTSSAVGSASASEELSSQSLILKNMIARFKLSEKHTAGESQYTYHDAGDDYTESSSSSEQDETPAVSAAPIISRYAYPSDEDGEETIKIVLDDEDDKY